MRTVHRIAAFFLILFFLYMAVTGGTIQAIDLTTLLTHAPASNTNMQAIRDSVDGPSNYVVIAVSDYDAPALPVNFDFAASLRATLHSARAAAGGSPFKYIDWRMKGNQPVAQFKTPAHRLILNAYNGQLLGTGIDRPVSGKPASAHRTAKGLHRGENLFGNWTFFVMIIGICLVLMIVTGLTVWGKLYADRIRLGRYNPFWGAGSRWRQLLRAIALVFSLLLLTIAFTGTLLEFDAVYQNIVVNQAVKEVGAAHAQERFNRDASTPLTDAVLPDVLVTTLSSFRRDHPATPIKALRLRYYSGYAQGVVIAGGSDTTQLVYNAHSGQTMSETEPGYAQVYYPFGWQAHETLKEIHRGDYFGLSGRAMSLLSSLALIYLSISGIVMYLELLAKRRRIGRKALFWS